MARRIADLLFKPGRLATFWSFLEATSLREVALVVGAFTVTACVATYPLILHLGDTLPSDLGDPLLNTWILAWDADRIRHGLQGLWDAPMFYPYVNTLAYSEHLLGIAVFTAPIQWATGNPMIGYNAAFLASFVLAGSGMYLLTSSLTGSRVAGLVGGIAFAFLPYRADQSGHLQVLMYGWMPVALWALHRYFATGKRLALTGFAVAFLLQGFSNGYFFYFFAAAVLIVTTAEFATLVRSRSRVMLELTVAALLMIAVTIPVAEGYLDARKTQPLYRTRGETVMYSADTLSYFHASPRLTAWGNVLPPGKPEGALFPGFGLMALAAFGLVTAFVRTQSGPRLGRVATVYGMVGLVGFAFSLGPELTHGGTRLLESTPYDWFVRVVPGLDGLRVPSRWAVIVFLALTVLATLGARRLIDFFPKRIAMALCVVIITVFIVEGAHPVTLEPFAQRAIPQERAAYEWLRQQPAGAAIIFPIQPRDTIVNTMRYVYRTLEHRHPIVNGYSGFSTTLVQTLQRFQREFDSYGDVLRGLRKLGVRYVVVHEHRYQDTPWMRAADRSAVMTALRAESDQLVARHPFGTSSVFELRPWDEPTVDSPEDQGLTPIDLSTLELTASHESARLQNALDGNKATRWTTDRPQAGDEWIEVVFEHPTDVAHVRLSMGSSLYDHPRHLVVEGSDDDGQTYTELYRGHGFPGFMLGLVHEPDSLPVEVGLPPNRSQILRFRQTGRSPSFYWSIHDLHLWTR